MRALVTGGTSGIGAAIVERLCSQEAAVVFTGRDSGRGLDVEKRTGASFVQADVRDPERVRASVRAASKLLGGLDALVLNAGVLHDAPLSDTSDEAWDAVLETNLVGSYLYAVACLSMLRASANASITAISSDAGVWGETSIGAYSVSKRALNTLVQTLAVETGPARVRVNAVCPGLGAASARARGHRRGRCGRGRLLRLARRGLLQRLAPARRRRHARVAPGERRRGATGRGMTTLYRLERRAALVTGGTSGIGKACVIRLREEGMRVAFTGRSRERGEAVAAETGAGFIECDHRDREASDRAVEQALDLADGRLDALVANAGILFQGSIEATPEDVFRELLEINLTALFRVSRRCFGPMRDHGGGSMIHIASDAGIRAVHEIAAYSVTKAGVIAAAELFSAEGAPYGIRSNAVCPGDIAPGVQATCIARHSGQGLGLR